MKTKRFRFLMFITSLLLCWLVPHKGMAYDVQVDGIYYNLNTSAKTATVTYADGYNSYSGAVDIPASFTYNGSTYRVTSIGSTAFLDCNGMTAISMPSSVTSIASSAFERCTGLTFLYIGSGVTTINYEAFKNCTSLTSLILPASVKTISDEVFSGCTSLTEIVAERTTAPTISSSTFNGVNKSTCTVYVPEGYRSSYANAANWKTFTNIEERTVVATGSCGDNVTYTIYSDMSMVISGTGAMWDYIYADYSSTTYINKEYYKSVKKVFIEDGVTTIGNYAFSQYESLYFVEIPNSVISLGRCAFSISNISSILIPSSVNSIGDRAFLGCHKLVSVSIPNGVTSIDFRTFSYCTNLRSIVIPRSVNYIGENAFEECNNLVSVHISDISTWCKIGFNYSSNPLRYAKHLYLNGEEIRELVIPNDVTSISAYTFYNCINLNSVTIPNSVTSIGEFAFGGCSGLTSVHISDISAWCKMGFNYSSNPLRYAKHLYLDGEEIKELVIPNDVTSIGAYTFYNCVGFTSVTIPNSVTSIGEYAFDGCSGLTSVHISDISAWCKMTFNYYNNPLRYANHLYLNGEEIIELVIPNDVTSIGAYAFYDCIGLTSVTIPNSVTSIGDSAFGGCDGLTSVHISDIAAWCNVTNYYSFGGSDNIHIFLDGEEIKDLIIPDTVSSIRSYAFFRFKGLISVTIPNSVTSIGSYAFSDCTDLTTVKVGNGVIDIDSNVFSCCTNLTSVTFENGLTVIGAGMFSVCTGLTSVNIPNSVATIGDVAFSGCTGLTSVNIPNSVTTIGDDAFRECSALTSVIIPNSVTTIGCNAFRECSALTSVTIPNSVTSIGERAFENCISLSSVNFPSSVHLESGDGYFSEYIGDRAFYGCSSLKSLVIPEGVQEIGVGSFERCSSLSLTLPSSLSSISTFSWPDEWDSYRTESGFIGVKSIIVDNDNPVFDSRDNCNAVIETATNKLLYGSKLTKVPDGVTTIGHYSLCNVSSIFIPSSVETIEAGAFCLSRDFWFYDDWERNHETREYDYSSYLLDSIIMESDVPPSASFSGVDQETCLLLVPFGSKSAYQNASGWKDFQNIIEYDPITDISALDNAIYVEKTEGRIGGTMDISVKLKNSYPVRGFQFRLELPEGTTINDWKLSTNRLPSGATLSDKIATQRIDGNTINVACSLNYGDATFTGHDGEIATVNVTFGDELEVGSYPIYLTACDVTTAGGTDEDLSDVKSTLVLEDYLPGDANGDGKIRIGDATAILNYIVGNVPSNFQEKAADTNGDGKIRIGDATAILNIIVNQ